MRLDDNGSSSSSWKGQISAYIFLLISELTIHESKCLYIEFHFVVQDMGKKVLKRKKVDEASGAKTVEDARA